MILCLPAEVKNGASDQFSSQNASTIKSSHRSIFIYIVISTKGFRGEHHCQTDEICKGIELEREKMI